MRTIWADGIQPITAKTFIIFSRRLVDFCICFVCDNFFICPTPDDVDETSRSIQCFRIYWMFTTSPSCPFTDPNISNCKRRFIDVYFIELLYDILYRYMEHYENGN